MFNIVIDPSRIQKEYFKDLFRYRELFYFLAWRDILVRYKQAFFGIAWAVIRPLLNMILFTLLFHRIANLEAGSVNYSLFVLAGMLPWQLFSNAVVDTSNSLLNNAGLISKTYFPRIIIPTAQIVVHFLDFAIGIALLVALMLAMGTLAGWTFFALPTFVLLTLMLSVGVSLWLSSVTVQYRDFRFIVPFIVQFGIFISPVGYSSSVIPEHWKMFYILNPLVGIIDGFRWTFFGLAPPDFLLSLGTSWLVTSFILITGYLYFRKTEQTFADRI